MATELRKIIDSVKELDFENKEVQNALVSHENWYEEKMKDLTGGGQLTQIKQALYKLKVEIKEQSLNEGVMDNALFSCGGMRHGKHHLYDEMADSVKVKE